MTCDDCGEDKPDAMSRGDVPKVKGKLLPVLCTACCAKLPGRAWMREDK